MKKKWEYPQCVFPSLINKNMSPLSKDFVFLKWLNNSALILMTVS